MEINEIKNLLIEKIKLEKVYIKKNSTHFDITIISEKFNNLNQLERHKIVYSLLKQYIVNKSIHSVSIRPYTKNEWEKYKKLNDL